MQRVTPNAGFRIERPGSPSERDRALDVKFGLFRCECGCFWCGVVVVWAAGGKFGDTPGGEGLSTAVLAYVQGLSKPSDVGAKGPSCSRPP